MKTLTQTYIKSFSSLSIDPWYGKYIKKIGPKGLEICLQFIQKYGELAKGDFESELNRYFLDREKPRDWEIISELLSATNTRTNGIERKQFEHRYDESLGG